MILPSDLTTLTAKSDNILIMTKRIAPLCLLKKFLLSPSLYIFCPLADLEILNLGEQWEDCVCEDNSSHLPAQDHSKRLAPIEKIK